MQRRLTRLYMLQAIAQLCDGDRAIRCAFTERDRVPLQVILNIAGTLGRLTHLPSSPGADGCGTDTGPFFDLDAHEILLDVVCRPELTL